MTEKKISRRDAIKMLGAVAGTSVLANLPSKWSTPELTTGVLPAHAQTSVACEEYSLQISVSGIINGLSGNWYTINPFVWPCSRTCPYFWVWAGTGGVTFTVTVLNNPSFQVNISTGQSYWIYLDHLSGEYNDEIEDSLGFTMVPPVGSLCEPIVVYVD